MKNITTIGFDADDTLWQNEEFFRLTQDRFVELLANYTDDGYLTNRLLQAEKRNLGQYGFGIKGFVLSMIETAIEVTDGRVPAFVISQIIEAGKDMLEHPIHLLPHARDAIEALTPDYKVILITKGDLLDQERKLAQSGLGELFNGVEIVSAKTSKTYHDTFDKHGDGPKRAMMVGNSMASDIVPAIEAGAWAVHVPSNYDWEVERADPPLHSPRFKTLKDLGGLPALVAAI